MTRAQPSCRRVNALSRVVGFLPVLHFSATGKSGLGNEGYSNRICYYGEPVIVAKLKINCLLTFFAKTMLMNVLLGAIINKSFIELLLFRKKIPKISFCVNFLYQKYLLELNRSA